jgi:hypothetical protein
MLVNIKKEHILVNITKQHILVNLTKEHILVNITKQHILVNITKQHKLLYEMICIVFYGRNCNGVYIHLLRRSTFLSEIQIYFLNCIQF